MNRKEFLGLLGLGGLVGILPQPGALKAKPVRASCCEELRERVAMGVNFLMSMDVTSAKERPVYLRFAVVVPCKEHLPAYPTGLPDGVRVWTPYSWPDGLFNIYADGRLTDDRIFYMTREVA